jgi:hypothetical protein
MSVVGSGGDAAGIATTHGRNFDEGEVKRTNYD